MFGLAFGSPGKHKLVSTVVALLAAITALPQSLPLYTTSQHIASQHKPSLGKALQHSSSELHPNSNTTAPESKIHTPEVSAAPSSVDPVYFGQDSSAKHEQDHQSFYADQQQPQQQSDDQALQYNPLGSFYALDEPTPTPKSHTQTTSQSSATPARQRQAPKYRKHSHDQAIEQPVPQSVHLQQAHAATRSQQQPSDLGDILNSLQFNYESPSSSSGISSSLAAWKPGLPVLASHKKGKSQRAHSAKQASASAKAANKLAHPTTLAHHRHQPVISLSHKPLAGALKTVNNAQPHRMNPISKLNAVYRPSIAIHSSRPIKLSTMINPGQVLLSKPGAGSARNVSSVSVAEIEELLQRLKPMAINGHEKARAEMSEADADSDSKDDAGDDETEEDAADSRAKDKLERVLLTSHLFGGPMGTMNKSRLDSASLAAESEDKSSSGETNALEDDNTSSQSSASDESVLLNSLANLGIQMGQQTPRNEDYVNAQSGQFYDQGYRLRPHVETYAQMAMRNKMEPPPPTPQQQLPPATFQPQSIPIELLVDHLMSSSRLATFGIQHGTVQDQVADATDDGTETSDDDDEEEEEEEEEDDQDNNGTLPLEASESVVSLTKMHPKSGASFSTVLNNSDSWIPLGSIATRHNLQSSSFKKGIVESTAPPKRKRKKRKKRKKKKLTDDANQTKGAKENPDESTGLVIGGKRLNRKDLIKLIGTLNKMASKREPSKERDASRKLLKFLIHLALNNFRRKKLRTKLSGAENEENVDTAKEEEEQLIKTQADSNYSDAAFRQSLRNILMGPIDSNVDNTNNNDSGNQSRPMDKRELEQFDPKPKTGKTFDNISEDLESYFDTEFFEDLADKNKPTNATTKTGAASNMTGIVLTAPKKRRASRLGYRLPVPIYGQQQIEAADEDDVELDHVRIKRPKAAKLSNRSGMKSTKREGSVRRRVKNRPKDAAPADRDSDEDDDDSEKDEEPGQATKVSASTPKRKKTQMVDRKQRRPEAGTKRRRNEDQEDAEPDEQADEDEEEDDSQANAADSDESPSEGSRTKKAADASPSDTEMNKENDTPDNKVDSTKKRRRRRKNKARQKDAKGANGKGPEIDLDTRDEIPAPITSGRPKVGHKLQSHKGQGSALKPPIVSAHVDASYGSKLDDDGHEQPSSSSPKERSASKTSKSQKHKLNKKSKSIKPKRTTPKRPDTDEPDSDEPSPAERVDPDYYNEGTSYSNICDDDGKCQVVVKSNNPELGKAIAANNEPLIAKQLGKWIEKESE